MAKKRKRNLSFLLSLTFVVIYLAILKLFFPRWNEFIPALFIITIVGSFLILLVKILLIKSPSENGIKILQINKLLPNSIVEANPPFYLRLMNILLVSLIGYVLVQAFMIALPFGIFWILIGLFLFLFVGWIFISVIQFTPEGIEFCTTFQYRFGVGGKFFIPYDKCQVGYMSGRFHGDNLIFVKRKFPYVTLFSNFWGNSWEDIITELKQRLPDSQLPLK